MSEISLLWPDFDKILKIGFGRHSKQMRTVTETILQVTLVQATFVLVRGGGLNHFQYFYQDGEPSKMFHQRLPSANNPILDMAIFHQRSSFIDLHKWSSSIKGSFLLKVVFHYTPLYSIILFNSTLSLRERPHITSSTFGQFWTPPPIIFQTFLDLRHF